MQLMDSNSMENAIERHKYRHLTDRYTICRHKKRKLTKTEIFLIDKEAYLIKYSWHIEIAIKLVDTEIQLIDI